MDCTLNSFSVWHEDTNIEVKKVFFSPSFFEVVAAKANFVLRQPSSLFSLSDSLLCFRTNLLLGTTV